MVLAAIIIALTAFTLTNRDRGAVRLNPALLAQVSDVTATMSPSDRAEFTRRVQEVQDRGITASQRARFITAVTAKGIAKDKAEELASDPIALLTIPVETVTDTPPEAVVLASVPHTDTCTSTDPYLTAHQNNVLGNRLATIRWVLGWCYRIWWNPIPYQLGARIIFVPPYQEPEYSTTLLCLNCTLHTTWHSEYWFPWDSAVFDAASLYHSGRANKVNFYTQECYGIWLVNQCFTQNFSWILDLHEDGSFFWEY